MISPRRTHEWSCSRQPDRHLPATRPGAASRGQWLPAIARPSGASCLTASITTKWHDGHSKQRKSSVAVTRFMIARQSGHFFSISIIGFKNITRTKVNGASGRGGLNPGATRCRYSPLFAAHSHEDCPHRCLFPASRISCTCAECGRDAASLRNVGARHARWRQHGLSAADVAACWGFMNAIQQYATLADQNEKTLLKACHPIPS
jgi:hypothetical protein